MKILLISQNNDLISLCNKARNRCDSWARCGKILSVPCLKCFNKEQIDSMSKEQKAVIGVNQAYKILLHQRYIPIGDGSRPEYMLIIEDWRDWPSDKLERFSRSFQYRQSSALKISVGNHIHEHNAFSWKCTNYHYYPPTDIDPTHIHRLDLKTLVYYLKFIDKVYYDLQHFFRW